MTILVTGSRGLVGSALVELLKAGHEVQGFDLRDGSAYDIRKGVPLAGVEGVVHLAAMSRVVTGERDPAGCVSTNVDALRSLYANARDQSRPPWILFVSSREVYGNTGPSAANEDQPLAPANVYARTKVDGERLSHEARSAGLVVNVARLSSVYGDIRDHADRVAPCFARTAATGGLIRVEGSGHVLDFTHIDDVARGLQTLVHETQRRKILPAIHFVSGRGTSLGALAGLSATLARAPVKIVEAPPRPYGVNGFVGDPARAREVLGWSATVPIETGLARLVDDFAAAQNAEDRSA